MGGKSDCSSKKSEAVGLLVGICGKTTVVCLKYAVHNIDKSVIENKVKLCCEKTGKLFTIAAQIYNKNYICEI